MIKSNKISLLLISLLPRVRSGFTFHNLHPGLLWWFLRLVSSGLPRAPQSKALIFPKPWSLCSNSPRKWYGSQDIPSRECQPRALGSIRKQGMSRMSGSLAEDEGLDLSFGPSSQRPRAWEKQAFLHGLARLSQLQLLSAPHVSWIVLRTIVGEGYRIYGVLLIIIG